MNERLIALYEFLESRGDVWTTQQNVVYALDDYYDVSSFWDSTEFHDSSARHLMTLDIRTINECAMFEKIIISSPRGIKLANEQEFSKYISKQYASVFRRLQRIRIKEKKGKANNKVVFDDNAEIDVVESLLRKFDK